MSKPNFDEERKLWKKGFNSVIGIDEAGRGPLAGPVVAVAVLVFGNGVKNLKGVKDSKELSFLERERLYGEIMNHPQIEWGIGRVSEKVIDKINILEATKLAMRKAVKNLEDKYPGIEYLLIDGNFGINLDVPQKSIIKGDQKVFSCAVASIIAKVSRDRTMIRYGKKYPEYGFDRHKGYGTKFHRRVIRKCGFCDIHRKTFQVS